MIMEIKTIDFEQANKQLEEIIAKLEDENTTLEEGMQLFEQATDLVKSCEEILKQAQIKIQMLKGDENEKII